MSQERITVIPPPTASPFTATTTGFERRIISSQRSWDTGGIFDVDIFTTDVERVYRELQRHGWTALGEPVDYTEAHFSVRQVVAVGPGGFMLAMIQRNWVRPMVGSGVEATVHYRIQRDGRIVDVRIATSSGINSFDLAALRAVQASTPLPPLPRAFREGSLGVNLIFR